MIRIFDTTLRDGEQSPGCSMNIREKLVLAKQLENLGVDVIEAGFAAASKDDFDSVRLIGERCDNAEICGLARCYEGDIEKTIRAFENATNPRIHVFIATSDLHLEHKLKISREEAVKKAIVAVKMAKQFTEKVDFSPEDATRSDWGFLVEILSEVVAAGADVLNIPDTVGYSTPEEFGALIQYLIENVNGAENVIFSTHCHNDLGLATANSLSGVRNGARQVECTINGIGERAGNASLEEIVMSIKIRPDIYPEGTNIDTTQLLSVSRLLTQITGQEVQPNKAVVGKNAFAHEAGIHQHGVLSNRLTYEIMKPEDVGYKSNQLVLGKHSGRAAVYNRLKELGVPISKEHLDAVFARFKELADKKKNIYDEDLLMMVMDQRMEKRYELVAARVLSEMGKRSKAKAAVRIGDEIHQGEGEGDGTVSALYTAIEKITGLCGELVEYNVRALTPERDAVGVVNIKWRDEEGEEWAGQASNTDTTMAAGIALIDVLNRMEVRKAHHKEKSRKFFVDSLLNT